MNNALPTSVRVRAPAQVRVLDRGALAFKIASTSGSRAAPFVDNRSRVCMLVHRGDYDVSDRCQRMLPSFITVGKHHAHNMTTTDVASELINSTRERARIKNIEHAHLQPGFRPTAKQELRHESRSAQQEAG
jgi:hypothetical protein